MRIEGFLVDSSVWLEVLPRRGVTDALRARMDELLAADLVATTGLIRLELLGGARSESEWQRLSDMLSALHYLPIGEAHWEDAARLGFRMRRQGATVPFTDLLIGVVALHAGATVVHRDRHFDMMANHLGLRVESHVGT